MDPRPVISIHGNVHLFRNVIQSSLKEKLRAKRPQDLERKGLSAYCSDVDFQLFDNFAKEQPTRLPFYSEPCLHTYWTDCSEVDQYRNRVRTEALSWVRYVEEHRSCKEVEWVVVHVTPEKDSKGKASSNVLEKMRSDFDSKSGGGLPRVISLKTSSGTPSKSVTEVWNVVTERVYSASVDGLRSLLNKHQTRSTTPQDKVEDFQAVFLDDVDLAVGLELINEPGKALTLYHELCTRLSSSLCEVARRKEAPPRWCTQLMEAPCHSWHCPCLDSSSESWKFLPALHSWKASLLEVKLFLYARMIFILFALRRVWQAETICSEVLHSTAREMKRFKPNCPPSAFDCWAYAIARMTVLEIMLHLTADVVGSAYASNSPLLIRVRLWSYAFEKLDAVGRECGLMPGSSGEPPKKDLLAKLLKGLDGQPQTVDEETQLVKALQSKEGFSEVYVDMGMRVIGALKHAGRRRAAFSVAKDVAMFLRDEGRLEEVVELLTDICKYYSGEGWVELSEGVYIILAGSLKELGRTEDYLRTVVQLISLYGWELDHPTADKRATPWMEELERLSQLPREELSLQSRLKWRPLFELVQLQRPSSVGDHCVVNSSVECTLQLKYHGPKDLSVSSISVVLQRDRDSPLNASQKVGSGPRQQLSAQDCPLEEEEEDYTDEGLLSLSKQYGSLESLDLLDEGPPLQPLTDVLSGSDEYLANLALETSLPQTTSALQPANSISSLDHLGIGDADGEFFLSAGPVLLKPGENTIKLTGLARSPGKFDMYKAVVSVDNLSFSTGVPAGSQTKTSVSVLDTENNISVNISPASSVVLAGLSQRCLLKLSVGPDTCIPKDALLRISSPTGIKFVTPPKLRPTGRLSPSFPRQQLDQPHPNCPVFLPAVEAGRSFTTSIHILAPSLTVSGADQMAEENVSRAWTHQIVVQCDWLVPVHTAAIPVTVFEPLSYCVKEVSAGDRVLVQLVMENSCPLPLLLRSPQLDTTLSMIQFHETPPQALLPGQDFSFLWQVQRDANEKVKQDQSCSFSVQWRAAYKSQEHRKTSEFHKSQHQFTVYSTATEYHVLTAVRTTNREPELRENCEALLKFVVKRCFNRDVAQSLSYRVELDERFWMLRNQDSGELYFPKLISEANMAFEICPIQSGELPMPCLVLNRSEKSSNRQDAEVYKPILVYSANKAEFVHVS